MFQLRRRGQVGFEDLLREMEVIEHSLLTENGALAMNLMVLEARLRERFQLMDLQIQEKYPLDDEDAVNDDIALAEIQALIPQDLPAFPTMKHLGTRRRRKRTIETVGFAALFALVTALGVFGLASILQLALSWIA